jgi:hypothetical protein
MQLVHLRSYLRKCTERKTSKPACSFRCKRFKFLPADDVTLRGDFAVKMAHFCEVTSAFSDQTYSDTNNK